MSLLNDVVVLALQAVFVFCVCYAVVSDFTRMLIPNWIPLTLVGAFAVFAMLYLDGDAVLRHLGLAAVVFVLGVVFFVAGWIGGGDVKLMTAVMLWIGPQAATSYVIVMAVLGAVLALTLLALRRYSNVYRAWAPNNWLVNRMVDMAEAGYCPYGVAIGIAALVPSAASIWQAGAVA